MICLLNKYNTAYDIDKVVEELEELRDRYDDGIKSFSISGIIKKTIEIVKQGGVGTETKTIRDKATEWNNHSSKKVPYEFIDFVEGKHEITNDDVCEWKKYSCGYAGFAAYNPKCCTEKSIGLESKTIIADWKYCPYCGKKIRLVECMKTRKLDKTKKSNIKCEHCEAFDSDKENGGWCCIHEKEKNYWNRCKFFRWSHKYN